MDRRKIVAICEVANALFFEDSSGSETDDEKELIPKVQNYAEVIIPLMNECIFKSHFRMRRTTFDKILSLLIDIQPLTYGRGHPELPLEKQLLITIWCLSNPECFRSVADRFGISKSTCWATLYKMCNRLVALNREKKIICWPTENRAAEISRIYEEKYHFPGIIGCIDGCHIAIKAPKESHASYINRKGFHSINLQAVCDNDLLFTSCYAGEVGSVHDACVYRRSDLYDGILNNTVKFPNNSHIIGDPAYPLGQHLMVAYKNNGHLTNRQNNFNYILSSARSSIERAFALLKGRFRRLKFMETTNVELIPLFILTACKLHNICLIQGDMLEEYFNLENNLQHEVNEPNNIENNNVFRIKRDNIARNLPMLNNNI